MFSFHPGDHRGFGGKSSRVQSFILSDSDINIRRKAPALIFKVRRLILRKGFWEVGGLNAFCLLCPSDSNWLTSREQSSCWGQKAYRSGGELRLCRSPSWQMGQDCVFCAPPGNLGGQWRRSLRWRSECGRCRGELRLQKHLSSSQVYVMECEFPGNHAILGKVPQGFWRGIIWNYFKIHWILINFVDK